MRYFKRVMASILTLGLLIGFAPVLKPDSSILPFASDSVSAAVDGEYWLSDEFNSESVDGVLQAAVQAGKTKIRFLHDQTDLQFRTGGSDVRLVIPQSITTIEGYEKGFFGTGPKTRRFSDSATSGDRTGAILVVPAGAHVSFSDIRFNSLRETSTTAGEEPENGVWVEIEEGGSASFKNCHFSHSVINKGGAVFEDCTFFTGKIYNSGSAQYQGSTTEPENLEQSSGNDNLPITLELSATDEVLVENRLPDGDKDQEYDQTITTTVTGKDADQAIVTAELVPAIEGLTATVDGDQVHIQGTPTGFGETQVQVTATLERNGSAKQTQMKSVDLHIYPEIKVILEGQLQAFISEQDSTTLRVAGPTLGIRAWFTRFFDKLFGRWESDQVDSATMASGGSSGGGSGGMINPNEENTYLDLFVENNGERLDAPTAHSKFPNDRLTFEITPDGSGMIVGRSYDKTFLDGKPMKPGEYQVRALLHYGRGQKRLVKSNPVRFHIYPRGLSLQKRMEDLEKAIPAPVVNELKLEPYRFENAGTFSWSKKFPLVLGSATSGTYATVGNTDSVGTEVITIPDGVSVTFRNMKFFRSVKFVVEKGGTLFIDDSGVFGPIEVNGGTIKMNESAAIMNTLTLNDGSVIDGAYIKSHNRHLTDVTVTDNKKPLIVDKHVVVNGKVTVRGDVTIKGDSGDASVPGQTALTVNPGAEVVVEDGAKLTVIGGGDELAEYAEEGGSAINLDNGKITGPGEVEAVGGFGSKTGGNGIDGKGEVSVDKLTAIGGDNGSRRKHLKEGEDEGGHAKTPKVDTSKVNKLDLREGAKHVILEFDNGAIKAKLELPAVREKRTDELDVSAWALLVEKVNHQTFDERLPDLGVPADQAILYSVKVINATTREEIKELPGGIGILHLPLNELEGKPAIHAFYLPDEVGTKPTFIFSKETLDGTQRTFKIKHLSLYGFLSDATRPPEVDPDAPVKSAGAKPVHFASILPGEDEGYETSSHKGDKKKDSVPNTAAQR